MYRTTGIFILIIFIGVVIKLPAQIDTINIPLITISDSFYHKTRNHLYLFDTLQMRINSGKNLASLINNSAIQIKSYGPGLVNTVGIRGSSGSQTSVYWNDFQVNNLMLGNSDLSLFTSGENNKIDIDVSGNSYGAIGGALKIKNEVPAIKESSLELSAGTLNNYYGTFQTNNGLTTIPYNATLSVLKNNNDFSYEAGKVSKENENSDAFKVDAAINTHFTIKSVFTKLFINYVNSKRQIPPSKYENESLAKQDDESLKLGLHSFRSIGKTYYKLKTGLFYDRLEYTNLKINEFSESKIFSGIGILEFVHQINIGLSTALIINDQYNLIRSSVYRVNGENILALTGSALFRKGKIFADIDLNTSYYQKKFFSPFPALDINYKITNYTEIGLKAGSNMRLPTYNDRFWNRNADLDLKHEESIFIELCFLNRKRSIFNYNLSIYHRQISNNIIWLPENGIWKASNINKSLSKGIEFETKTLYTIGKSTFQWKNSYKHNRTILDDKAKGFDSTLALYNPEHLFYSSVRFLKKNFYAEISFKYNSRLYTTFDNTEFLDPVLLGNFYTGITSKYKKMDFHLDLAIENIFGVEYESIKNYAMPGRVLTLKARIIFNNTK